MAKRKLSAEQRAKLRAELAEGVKSGRKTPELLEQVSKRFGITTITARWYLKSIGVKPKRRGKRLGRPPGSKNGLPKILDNVHAKALETIGLAEKAKRLVPKWEKLLKRQAELNMVVQKAQQQLQRVSKRAKTIGDKITSLVGR
jgi:hypothetical protein